jgi:hypothetical protein
MSIQLSTLVNQTNPLQLCKAWVNFNGTFGYVTGQSYSRTGTTVTVTTTNHLLTNGQLVQIASATDTALNGQNYPITVVNANQFSFQTTSTGTATGTLSWTGVIRSGYNISSITKNGTGDYTVNFATPMSDANYSVVITASSEGNGYFVGGSVNSYSSFTTAPSTSSVRVFTSLSGSNNLISAVYTNVQIFGN